MFDIRKLEAAMINVSSPWYISDICDAKICVTVYNDKLGRTMHDKMLVFKIFFFYENTHCWENYGKNDEDELKFNDVSIHEDQLHQNSILIWFKSEMAIIMRKMRKL